MGSTDALLGPLKRLQHSEPPLSSRAAVKPQRDRHFWPGGYTPPTTLLPSYCSSPAAQLTDECGLLKPQGCHGPAQEVCHVSSGRQVPVLASNCHGAIASPSDGASRALVPLVVLLGHAGCGCAASRHSICGGAAGRVFLGHCAPPHPCQRACLLGLSVLALPRSPPFQSEVLRGCGCSGTPRLPSSCHCRQSLLTRLRRRCSYAPPAAWRPTDCGPVLAFQCPQLLVLIRLQPLDRVARRLHLGSLMIAWGTDFWLVAPTRAVRNQRAADDARSPKQVKPAGSDSPPMSDSPQKACIQCQDYKSLNDFPRCAMALVW